jgi:hypothetical protein
MTADLGQRRRASLRDRRRSRGPLPARRDGRLRRRRGVERSHDRHRVAFGRRIQQAVRGQHRLREPPLGRGVRRHDRGLHLPRRVRAERRLGRAFGGRDARTAGASPLRSGLPHTRGQRHRRSGSRLQAASDLRRAGSPSEKAYATVNDSPEAIAFSWEFSTTPVSVTGRKPTSLLTVDSTKSDPARLARHSRTSSSGRPPTIPSAQPGRGHRAVHRWRGQRRPGPGGQPAHVRRGHRRHHPPGRHRRPVEGRRQQGPGRAASSPRVDRPRSAPRRRPGYNLVGDETWTFERP